MLITHSSQPKTRIIFLILLTSLLGCSPEGKQPTPRQVPLVEVRFPQVVSRHDMLAVSGELKPAATIQLAFQVPGQVEQVWVQEGERVKRGTQLARLKSDDFNNARLAAAAKYNELQRRHQRLAVLYQRGSLTLNDMDKIDAALKESRANLSIVEQKVADTWLKAPQQGVLAHTFIEPGSVVAPGQPVMELVQVDQLTVALSISQQDIDRLAPGQKLRLRFPALPGIHRNAQITELLPMADQLTRSYIAQSTLDNSDGRLHPGMIVLADILLDDQETILTIPPEAVLVTPEGNTYLYVLTSKQNSVQRRQVTVTGVHHTEVTISTGLRADEQVVIKGQNRLSDGTVIRVAETPADKTTTEGTK